MNHSIRLFKLLMFILVGSVLFAGCVHNRDVSEPPNTISSTEDAVPDRHLKIQLIADPKANEEDDSYSQWFSNFSSDQIGGNFSQGLKYVLVKDVTIEIDGSNIDLDQALRSNRISEEDIFYYARKDAANGICQEVLESNHGLTTLFYFYPEYDLHLNYDLLETPDGQQHLISNMGIYATGVNRCAPYSFVNPDTFTRYDLEDWGLNFTTEAALPTGIQLNCTQSGGQQIGQLWITNFEVWRNDIPLPRIDKDVHATTEDDTAIEMHASSQITLDWTPYYGELPKGEYMILLYVTDIFNKEDVHPLMVDYHDMWVYTVDFSVS